MGHLNGADKYLHGSSPAQWSMFGKSMGAGRVIQGGLAFGLGALAFRNAQDTYHKLKYGEIGGAMLSAAVGTAAAAGAFHMATKDVAMKNMFKHARAGLGRLANYVPK